MIQMTKHVETRIKTLNIFLKNVLETNRSIFILFKCFFANTPANVDVSFKAKNPSQLCHWKGFEGVRNNTIVQ